MLPECPGVLCWMRIIHTKSLFSEPELEVLNAMSPWVPAPPSPTYSPSRLMLMEN